MIYKIWHHYYHCKKKTRDYLLNNKDLLKEPIADVGGGSGVWSELLGASNIDLKPHAKIIADITDMRNVKSDSFNSAVCINVLEHIENPDKALQEIKRILSNGSYVLFSVPFTQPFHNYDDYNRWTHLGLQKLLSKYFEVVNIEAGEGFVPTVLYSISQTIYNKSRSRIFYPLYAVFNVASLLTDFIKTKDVTNFYFAVCRVKK